MLGKFFIEREVPGIGARNWSTWARQPIHPISLWQSCPN